MAGTFRPTHTSRRHKFRLWRPGHEPHHDGLVGDDQAHLRDAENENEEGFENEERKFKKSYSENLKSCSILDTKFEIEDYEGVIYRELSRKIDWSV